MVDQNTALSELQIVDKSANPLIFKVNTPLINTVFKYEFHLRGEAEVGGTHLEKNLLISPLLTLYVGCDSWVTA